MRTTNAKSAKGIHSFKIILKEFAEKQTNNDF